MAVHFAQVKLSNLLLADHDGRVREGRHALNRAGFVLHSAVHAAHPDIVAMCHAHTVYGVAWAAMGRLLDPITQDACCFFEDHVVIADESLPPRKRGAALSPWSALPARRSPPPSKG